MVAEVREVRVFVASPGDCDAERQRVRKVADDVNTALGTTFGLRLSVDGWEQLPPDLGRPQDQINPLVDECDIFVGVLAYRWGTPTGVYDSGFHEEFDRVRVRRGDTTDPHIALYFKNASKQQVDDPGEQLQAVLAFRGRVENERLALYDMFDGADDLEPKLWQLFTRVLARLSSVLRVAGSQGSSAQAAGAEATAGDFASSTIDEAREQIARTADAVAHLARHGAVPTHNGPDTDRLLLIAMALNRDSGYLSGHVANRLFARRAELTLSMMEVDLWLETLLADIGGSGTAADRVIPGFGIVRVDDDDLVAATSHDDGTVAGGAFRVLEQTRSRPAALWDIANDDVDDVIHRWAEALGRGGVADAALNYLAHIAAESDLALLDLILSHTENDSLAVLRGILASDPSPAARFLASAYSPPQWMLAVVKDHLSEVNHDGLTALVSSSKVGDVFARAAFTELVARGGPDDATLTAFLRRDDALDIVVTTAQHSGSTVMAERLGVIKDSLDEKTAAHLDLRVALLALGETVDHLLDLVANGVMDAWKALVWKRDSRLVGRARVMYDTDAAEIIDSLLQSEVWRGSGVLPFVRWQMRIAALRILANSGDVTEDDRARFRRELTAKGWGTDAVRLYLPLARTEDLELLVSLLDDAHGEVRSEMVGTVLRIAGSAGARTLLELVPDKPDAVAAVHALGPDPEVGNDELRELLYAPHDNLRMAALSELAARLDRNQLEELIDAYAADQRAYYYNVIAELDRLLYLPSK